MICLTIGIRLGGQHKAAEVYLPFERSTRRATSRTHFKQTPLASHQTMKAYVYLNVDLRNHDRDRSWQQGFADNYFLSVAALYSSHLHFTSSKAGPFEELSIARTVAR